MRLIKILSAIVFFVSIPFISYSVSLDAPHAYPIANIVTFGALAAYSSSEAFFSPLAAGNRLKTLGFKILFFSCASIAAFGLFQVISGAVNGSGT